MSGGSFKDDGLFTGGLRLGRSLPRCATNDHGEKKGEEGDMLRHDSSRSADRDRVLMRGRPLQSILPMAPALRLGQPRMRLYATPRNPEAIKLDLYHLVWIFAVCSVRRLVGETVVSYFI